MVTETTIKVDNFRFLLLKLRFGGHMKFIITLFVLLSPALSSADVLEESEAHDLTQVLQNAKPYPSGKPQGRQVVRINDKDNIVREVELKEVQEIEERTPAADEE